MDAQELKFYESLIDRFKNSSAESLLNKRASQAKEDPTEELIELHLEIQELERQFKELIDISSYMLKKNKEMDELMNSRPNTPGAGARGTLNRLKSMQATSAIDVEKTNL